MLIQMLPLMRKFNIMLIIVIAHTHIALQVSPNPDDDHCYGDADFD